jgi:hypothetical protein
MRTRTGFAMLVGVLCCTVSLSPAAGAADSGVGVADAGRSEEGTACALYKKLKGQWEQVRRTADPKTKDSYAQRITALRKSVDSLSDGQTVLLVTWFRRCMNDDAGKASADFDHELAPFLMGRALLSGKADVIELALTRLPVRQVDGRYVEWQVEKATSRAPELMYKAYEKSLSEDVKRSLVEAFRRASPDEWHDGMSEEDFVRQCHATYAARRETLVLNPEYPQPPTLNSAAAPAREGPEPPRRPLGLFVAKKDKAE